MSLLKKKKRKRHSVFLFIFKGVLLQLPGGTRKDCGVAQLIKKKEENYG